MNAQSRENSIFTHTVTIIFTTESNYFVVPSQLDKAIWREGQ